MGALNAARQGTRHPALVGKTPIIRPPPPSCRSLGMPPLPVPIPMTHPPVSTCLASQASPEDQNHESIHQASPEDQNHESIHQASPEDQNHENIHQASPEDENHESIYQHLTKLVSALPSRDGGIFIPLYRHPDGWHTDLRTMVGAMIAQQHFKARATDVLLASFPKSGTTWLKALLFATINRSSHSNSQDPFTTHSPHECIPFFESQVYANDQIPDLDVLPSPRLFSTHIPFQSLPQSVLDSGCRIVHLCRNPKDNFVSWWHFANNLRAQGNIEPLSLEKAVDIFCEGTTMFGSYWDHLLRYWKGHLERPQNVFFLKYEEMMLDPVVHLKRLAEFIGFPFTLAEEEEGVVEGIVRLCGFENLSSLEVNKIGKTEFVSRPIENSTFFRRGVIGDWVNYLAPEMVRRLDEMTESKFGDSGLTFS